MRSTGKTQRQLRAVCAHVIAYIYTHSTAQFAMRMPSFFFFYWHWVHGIGVNSLTLSLIFISKENRLVWSWCPVPFGRPGESNWQRARKRVHSLNTVFCSHWLATPNGVPQINYARVCPPCLYAFYHTPMHPKQKKETCYHFRFNSIHFLFFLFVCPI